MKLGARGAPGRQVWCRGSIGKAMHKAGGLWDRGIQSIREAAAALALTLTRVETEAGAAASAWPSWVLHACSRNRARAAAEVRGRGQLQDRDTGGRRQTQGTSGKQATQCDWDRLPVLQPQLPGHYFSCDSGGRDEYKRTLQ